MFLILEYCQVLVGRAVVVVMVVVGLLVKMVVVVDLLVVLVMFCGRFFHGIEE